MIVFEQAHIAKKTVTKEAAFCFDYKLIPSAAGHDLTSRILIEKERLI